MIELQKVATEIPLDKMLIETDSPFLVPHDARKSGTKRNEPKYVKMVAQKIAELRGITLKDVADTTTANAKQLFNI